MMTNRNNHVPDVSAALPPEVALKEAGLTVRKPATFYGAKDAAAAKRIAIWLYIMCAMVAIMVTIGGATRLTDSGLSITQWDLIIGSLPPMSEEKWLDEFEKYKQIPEYERVNKGMSLDGFKEIYWWEWGHRNFGRLIGLAFLFPMLWFFARGEVKSTGLKLRLGGLFLLICAQGALGWYMVSSGLVDRVDVSQYRLAAHLGLAVILYIAMLWCAFSLSLQPKLAGLAEHKRRPLRKLTAIMGGLVFLQIIFGAFVAGLRAGKAYTSWPLMNGEFFPSGYFAGKADFLHAFETMAAVQFNHRVMAYALMGFAIFYWWQMRQAGEGGARHGALLLGAIWLQAGLGIWTLVTAVPINLGLAHQLGALGVLSVALINLYRLGPTSAD